MRDCRRRQHHNPREVSNRTVYKCCFCSHTSKKRAKREFHYAAQHQCQFCSFRGANLTTHTQIHTGNQTGGGGSIFYASPPKIKPFKEINAFKGCVKTYHSDFKRRKCSLQEYFELIRPSIQALVLQNLNSLKTIKAQFTVHVTFKRYLFLTEVKKKKKRVFEYQEKPINSYMLMCLNGQSFDRMYSNWTSKIMHTVSIFERYGSGWRFHRIRGADLRVAIFRPQRGGCWVSIPKKLLKKKALVNVIDSHNREMCFKWAILSSLHSSDLKLSGVKNSNRKYYYKEFEELYDFSTMSYPVEICDIPSFESLNHISVNVFNYDWFDGVLPVYISPNNYKSTKTANIMLLTNENYSHYLGITNIHRLLGKENHHRRLLCYNCLQTFPLCKPNSQCDRLCNLNEHTARCSNFKFQFVKMPEVRTDGSKPISFFINTQRQLKAGFVVYADFECLLIPTFASVPPNIDHNSPYTLKKKVHIPCGYSYVVVDTNGDIFKIKTYRGEDAVDSFLESLDEVKHEVFGIYSNPLDIIISPEEQLVFNESTRCHICEEELDEDDKVRDHCHLTGAYRGPAHNQCNLNYHQLMILPVIMHNLRSYDSHLVVHGFKKFGDKIQVVPTSTEKFMSIKVDGLNFIDSLQFMNTSLDKLVKYLVNEQNDSVNFKLLRQHFKTDQSTDLMKQKGVYPYDYFDDWQRFEEPNLPKRRYFFNELKNNEITLDAYKYAQHVYEHFNCRNLGDLHDLYVTSDTLQLACVFENFRRMSIEAYKLDPVHYISAPGLGWDAALRMTKVKIELLTEIDIHEFIELGMRGGVSMITKRKSIANNQYMTEFTGDSQDKDQIYIISWDMNNLYGKVRLLTN